MFLEFLQAFEPLPQNFHVVLGVMQDLLSLFEFFGAFLDVFFDGRKDNHFVLFCVPAAVNRQQATE